MQSQDIALNLVAKLDQGNIGAEASNMGKTLKDAIESAFEGLGERLAKKILSDLGVTLQQGLGSAVSGLQIGGMTQTAQQQAAIAMDQGNTVQLDYGARQGNAFRKGGNVPEMMDDDFAKIIDTNSPGASTSPGSEPQSMARQALDWLKKNKKAVGGISGVAGIGIDAYGTMEGEMPGIQRQAEASRSEIGGMQGREMMRGQIEDIMAQQTAGGLDQMKSKAGNEELAKHIALGLKTAMVDIGVGAAAGSVVPGVGTTAGAVVGAGKAIFDIYKQTGSYDTDVEKNIQGQTDAERKRNAEFMSASSRGRSVGLSAYHGSQMMGAEELSPFLTGEHSRGQALSSGLSESQFEGALQGFGGMGGVFNGKSALDGQTGGIDRLLKQMGQGFGAAPQVAQGLVGGGMDQGSALKASADMFEDAVAAGIDKAKVGDALIRMSSRAESMGIGGSEVAMSQERQAMAEARRNFGPDVQDSQLRTQEAATQFMNRRSGQGLEFTGSMQGLRGLEKKTGAHLRGQSGNALEYMLASGQVDSGGLKMAMDNPDFKDSGIRELIKKIAPNGDLEAAAKAINEAETKGTENVYERGVGKVSGRLAQARQFAPAGSTLSQTMTGYNTAGDTGTGKSMEIGHDVAVSDATGKSAELKSAAIQQASVDAMAINSGLKSLAQQIPLMVSAVNNFYDSLKKQSDIGFKGPSLPASMTPQQKLLSSPHGKGMVGRPNSG